MKIRWNGHSCFTLTNAEGHTLLTDPYDPATGYDFPQERVNVVTTSHHHRDHDYVEALEGCDTVLDKAETAVSLYGFTLSSMSSFHDDANGTKRGLNQIFRIQADGQTVVHLGDLGHFPTEAQLAFIRGADVLLIPVGGFFTIDTDTAVRIIKAAAPEAAVAMHFKAARNEYPISDAARFIRLTNAQRVGHEAEISSLHGCCVFDYE